MFSGEAQEIAKRGSREWNVRRVANQIVYVTSRSATPRHSLPHVCCQERDVSSERPVAQRPGLVSDSQSEPRAVPRVAH